MFIEIQTWLNRGYMNRGWTPPSRVSKTDGGTLIEIELEGVSLSTVLVGVEDGSLIVAGEHRDWGRFELQFDIPPDHSVADATSTLVKGVLKIELPCQTGAAPIPGKALPSAMTDTLMKFPRPMLLYCTSCGKHFDIVLTSQKPSDFQCPSCGAVQQFAFGEFLNKAIKQSREMLRRKHGRS